MTDLKLSSFRLSAAELDQLRDRAAAEGTTVSALVRRGIEYVLSEPRILPDGQLEYRCTQCKTTWIGAVTNDLGLCAMCDHTL